MKNYKYDYLIVGSGMFGSVFSREMTRAGKKCLVIDSRNHIGGNCYTEKVEGINIHKYGAHIFHTKNLEIWNYIRQFGEFNNYIHKVVVKDGNVMYSFPINLMTLYQLWGVTTPEEAQERLNKAKIPIENPSNLKEWALSQVGEEIYKIFIEGYTTKQWMRPPEELPTFIIKRIPIRTDFDETYFSNEYQGIPKSGYTKLFENMLMDTDVQLGIDYFDNKKELDGIARKIIFTGKIDQFYDFRFGELDYRTLKFEHKTLNIKSFQGNSVVNYASKDVPYTRILEHKHFEYGTQDKTVITYEYPVAYTKGCTPYYPINDDKNNEIFSKYKDLSKTEDNVMFGGRLAEYKYYDMHQVVGSALMKAEKELEK